MAKQNTEPITVDTLDQKLLYDLLHEQQEQTRRLKSITQILNFWTLIGILGIILTIVAQLF